MRSWVASQGWHRRLPATPGPPPPLQVCRVNNIGRWPFRKRSSLNRLIEKTKEYFASDPEQCAEALAQLEAQRTVLRVRRALGRAGGGCAGPRRGLQQGPTGACAACAQHGGSKGLWPAAPADPCLDSPACPPWLAQACLLWPPAPQPNPTLSPPPPPAGAAG